MLANFGVRGSIWPEFHHRERGIRQAWTVAYCAVMGLLLSSPPAFAAGRVFYDGFEDGTTNAFRQTNGHLPCQVVTSSLDGVKGPNGGRYMLRCNWLSNDYESVDIASLPGDTNELLYRVRLRVDADHDRCDCSGAKVLRIFVNPIFDVFGEVRITSGIFQAAVMNGEHLGSYWGGNGDNTASPSEWHTIEYYFNRSTGALKIWHDDVLVYERTVTYAAWVNYINLLSNFAGSHDNANHVYFDDIEVFTEVGNTATGSMADGTVSVGSAPVPPSGVRVD